MQPLVIIICWQVYITLIISNKSNDYDFFTQYRRFVVIKLCKKLKKTKMETVSTGHGGFVLYSVTSTILDLQILVLYYVHIACQKSWAVKHLLMSENVL